MNEIIEFIKQNDIQIFIFGLILFEVISYVTWNNQDYEKWLEEFKLRWGNTLFWLIALSGLLFLEYHNSL